MAEDNGRLSFSAYIDNSELQSSAAESKRILASLGDIAEQQGGRMDNSLRSALSGVRAMAKEASEVFSLIGQNFDVSTTEAKMSALETVIKDNEAVIQSLSEKFDDLGTRAKAAFGEGNFEEFDNLSAQMESTATQISDITAETDNYRAILESMKVAQGDASVAIDDTTQKEQQQSNILITLLGGQEKYNAIVSQLPPSLKATCQGIVGMTGAAKAFIATPLGAVLAAIILALQTLKTWFNSTVEGQLAFAKVSGYVSGVLGQLKEIVITVGKALFNAFSDPKQAIKDLWEAIKENVVNRFKAVGDIASALGKVIKAAFTLDTDGIKSALKELADGFLQFGTGVENVTEKVADWVAGVHDAATATADIAQAEKQLEIEVSEWQKTKEQLEQAKADARMKMYDTSLSREEREKALNAYKDALNKQLAKETEFANRRIELQKRTMSLTSNTIEDENKLRDLEAEAAKIKTQAARELAMLQESANRITNTNAQDKKSNDDLVKLIEANTQAEIDAMAEGSAKKIAQIRFNYEKEIAEVKRQEARWREQQAGELTSEQQTALSAAISNAERKRNKEELDATLADIETYEQRRTEIQQQYAERRKSLFVDGDESKGLKAGVTQGNVDELDRNAEKALSAIDEEFASREYTYQAWCEQIANMSLEQLENVLAKAKEELDKLEAEGEQDSKKLASARAKVATAQEKVNKARAKTDAGVDKRTIKEWEDLYKTLNEVVKSFEEIGDEIGGVAGEAIKTAGTIATSTLSMINGIVQLVNMSATAMKGTSEGASKAIQTVEKASVILAVITAAMQVAMAIVNLFNSDEQKQKEIEALQSRIDQLQWELDNADIMQLRKNSIDSYKMVRAELEGVRAALIKEKAAANDVWGVLKLMNGGAIKDTELLSKAVERLATAYGNVAYTADKALGGAKYDNAKAQLDNIAEQQLLIQQQIDAEDAKKKTDHGKISEWEQKIEELGAQAIQLINELVEDIIGGSATDIAEELGDAFIDAFKEGEDAAQAWGDKVNDIVADILKRMLVQQYLEKPLGEIFNKYKERWFPDGKFTSLQAVIDSMEDFAADINAEGENFKAIWEALPESIKDMFSATSDAAREASQKGIATASQESVDELNGRMTAVQGHTFSIAENTKLLVANTGAILESVVAIESHTQRLASVEANIKSVKDTVNDIALKGIKIR